MFIEPIATPIPPRNKRPHGHTPIPGTTLLYHIRRWRWLSLLLLFAASQRGAFLSIVVSGVLLSSIVYHTTAAARGPNLMLPTTTAPAVALAALGWVQLHERSFGGLQLSPKLPTRWDNGSPSRCSRRQREAQSCQPISGNLLVGVHGAKKRKRNRNFGVYVRVCHQSTKCHVVFDGLQQYERLQIHPPKHGLPANCAIDSRMWLSRVSVLGASLPYPLFARVYIKPAVCSMVSRQQHTGTSVRTTYHSNRKCNIFLFININIQWSL